LAFSFGTTGIIHGWASAGMIVNVFFAVLIGAFSLAQLPPNLQALAFAQGAVVKLYETIDRVPTIDSQSEEGLKPNEVEGVIQVEVEQFLWIFFAGEVLKSEIGSRLLLSSETDGASPQGVLGRLMSQYLIF
jgi:hypothetical protein